MNKKDRVVLSDIRDSLRGINKQLRSLSDNEDNRTSTLKYIEAHNLERFIEKVNEFLMGGCSGRSELVDWSYKIQENNVIGVIEYQPEKQRWF